MAASSISGPQSRNADEYFRHLRERAWPGAYLKEKSAEIDEARRLPWRKP